LNALTKYTPSLFVLIISLLAFNSSQAATFSQAKKQLATMYKGQHQTSFYCGCDFNYQCKELKPDLNSCRYQVRKQKKRITNRMGTHHAA
jgi:deoxyribonuclease-1